MTNPHPLTDKDCFDIQWDPQANYQDEVDLIRAGYDKGYDKGAADNLDQVIEWLDDNLRDYLYGFVSDEYKFAKGIIEEFKQAMRPQQEDNK